MFANSLKVEELDDGTKKLLEPLFYNARGLTLITVPAGFITDYDSVPRLLGIYVMFKGLSVRSPVVHDYMYSMAKYPRKYADKTFFEAMLSEGVTKWKAYVMFIAVRLFGKSKREKAYGVVNE